MKRIEVVTTILITLISINILYRIKPNINNREPSKDLVALQEYVKSSVNSGKELVVLFTSGNIYGRNNNLLFFRDKVTLSVIESGLAKEGVSLVVLNTPCLAGDVNCITEFVKIANGIVALNPLSIIYKGIDSGISGESFDLVINDADIPIYTINTRVAIENDVYIGPDNEGLGIVAYEGIKEILEEGDKVIYLETVRNTYSEANDIASVTNDNGFPRIEAIRKRLGQEGVIEQATLFTQWSESKTFTDIITEIRRNGPPKLIVAPSYETAKGTIEALKSLKIDLNVTKVIALDYGKEVQDLIKDGVLYGAVSQNLIGQALRSVELAVGKNRPKSSEELFVGEFITLDLINSSNKIYW